MLYFQKKSHFHKTNFPAGANDSKIKIFSIVSSQFLHMGSCMTGISNLAMNVTVSFQPSKSSFKVGPLQYLKRGCAPDAAGKISRRKNIEIVGKVVICDEQLQ